MSDVTNRISRIVEEVLCITIEGEMNPMLIDIGINSLNFIKLVLQIEKEFGISFDDRDLIVEKYPTIEGLVEYVKKKYE